MLSKFPDEIYTSLKTMMLGLSDGEDHVILRPVHTGNKYCCRKRQQIGNKLLPFLATICCRFRQQSFRFWQQFVAEK